jgi:uncharacterized 2Fe-2S/4Fe-4S cluster protein (DUF4445 family)
VLVSGKILPLTLQMKITLNGISINAHSDETILLACARGGIILSAPCGGQQRCGKCKVQVLEGQVKGDIPDADGWVKACAAFPVSDITIACPRTVELAGTEVASVPVTDNRYVPARAAVAIDIGTTTVAARLIDLDSQEVLDTVSELNDQRAFGADVMNRIGAAQNDKTTELFTLINRQTERILSVFIKKWNLPCIEKLAVSGNTVMLHLFLNVDPSSMGKVPFTPVFLDERELGGDALSLPVKDVTILPSIAAFIGGDITAGLAVLDILNVQGPSLFIDIGTNGEMALAHNGTIFCCSTAAGPAFEGAEISCGVGGIKGAVSSVECANNAISICTIGNAPPVGICGSGLIDTVAFMLEQEIIDETGLMAGQDKKFFISPNVSITARDIRQFQLAKSAILSGIRILCKVARLQLAEIRKVFIAGGFGFFINKQNAIAAGIFPKEFRDSISICGNLSLQGAQECLVSDTFLDHCRQIITQCTVIDLASDPSFLDEFTENMLFNVLGGSL